MDIMLFNHKATPTTTLKAETALRRSRNDELVSPSRAISPPRHLQMLWTSDGKLVRLVRSETEMAERAAVQLPVRNNRPLRSHEVNMTTAKTTGYSALGGPRRRDVRKAVKEPGSPGLLLLLPHMMDSGSIAAGSSQRALLPSQASTTKTAPPAAAAAAVYSREEIERIRLAARKEGFPHLAVSRVDDAAATAASVMHLKRRPSSGPAVDPEAAQSRGGSPPLGQEPSAAAQEQARLRLQHQRKDNRLSKMREEADAREVMRWERMKAQEEAAAARTAALQASGAKARRNRSGASYDLLTLAPRDGADAAAMQAREAAAIARRNKRVAALAKRSSGGGGFDILTGLPTNR